jgi:hypothetical protein
LIDQESTLQEVLSLTNSEFAAQAGFTVALLNDFDVPWVVKGGQKYPSYKLKVKLKKREVEEGDDSDDAEQEAEDEDEEQ